MNHAWRHTTPHSTAPKCAMLRDRQHTRLGQTNMPERPPCVVPQEQLQHLAGDALLSAAIVSHSGLFSSKGRQRLCEEWQALFGQHGVELSPGSSLAATMATPQEVLPLDIPMLFAFLPAWTAYSFLVI